MDVKFVKALRIVSLILVFFLGLFLIYAAIIMSPESVMGRMAQEHFPAVIGLPAAAVSAFFLVLILKQTSGNIKFKGLGFEFEGASGEVVLWIFVFLSISGAIKALW